MVYTEIKKKKKKNSFLFYNASESIYSEASKHTVICFVNRFSCNLYDQILLVTNAQAAYTVGGCSFSAACIEHVILKMKALAYKPQTVWKLLHHSIKFNISSLVFVHALQSACL